jgi:hypothetical protein
MHIPEYESDFVKFAYWIRPNTDDDLGFVRAQIFAGRLHDHPSLAGIQVFDDEATTMERALEFRRLGRPGLYIACLVYLGLKSNPIACLTLAGILIQRAQYKEPPNQRMLLRRAFGWLKAADSGKFANSFGLQMEAFSRIEKASNAADAGKISELRRQIERNERKVTLIDGILPKWKSESGGSSEKYRCLTEPLPLRGDLTAASSKSLLDTLRSEYPWADDLLSDIETALTLSVSSNRPWLSLPPILIVGPPGIGKTRFTRRLGEITGVPARVINAGGSADNRDFSGTARGWGTAHPARIVEILRETETANPIVLLDEIDKAGGGDRNGRITATLLTMLEPETRARFYDEALATNVDLSYVNWILTANDVRALGRPLLSRLRVVHMSAPPATAAPSIVETVLRDIAASYGWPDGATPTLAPEVRKALVDALSKGASPRNIWVMIEQILAIELKWRRSGLN